MKNVKKYVDDLMSKMTLEEKIEMLEGKDDGHMQGVERLGIPDFRLSDGPLGAQGATAFPSGIALASSWDRDLARRYGEALGNDSRAVGVDCILGPGINIIRTPLAGRSSEYFSEDPYLTAEMAVPEIEGIQSKKVMACAKHYAANSMENYRTASMSLMDERTLREIYLPAFEAAVKRAKVATVMNSYNGLNGTRTNTSRHLNLDILRDEWGFDGFNMSDWGAGQGHPKETLMNGLDLAMPVGEMGRPAVTKKAIEEGSVTLERVDEAVRHILTKAAEFDMLEGKDRKKGFKKGNAFVKKVCYDTGAEGTVLLKNNGVLPLKDGIKIALMGPNAVNTESGILGSSHVDCDVISLFKAIRTSGKKCRIKVVPDIVEEAFRTTSVYHFENGEKVKGWIAGYYDDADYTKKPALERTEEFIYEGHAWRKNNWLREYSGNKGSMGVMFTAKFVPEQSGEYVFVRKSNSGTQIFLDGKLILDDMADIKARPYTFEPLRFVTEKLEAGREYDVKLTYRNVTAQHDMNLSAGIFKPDYSKIKNAAKAADVVIYCAGVDMCQEGEGVERQFKLPGLQDESIAAAASKNKNVIVLHNGCGAFDMTEWIDDVAAVMQCWYPGRYGSLPVADILFGKINPSGKLTVTFDRTMDENPSIRYFYPDLRRTFQYPIYYREGVFMGYRGYEIDGVKPLFPFGYGLSYTTYEYSDVKVEKGEGDILFKVSCDVKNTGKIAGDEIVEMYIGDVASSVMRPIKELKGFERIHLEPGEKKTVRFDVKERDLAFYDEWTNSWKAEAGEFIAYVGPDSENTKNVHFQY
ncbi:MAG: glycoside hydrolase family 3 C-terminal domain-containing protein [Clostridia bacterium]|nr:glycoside hydrolase family 3 C-terminal domain-containing protein [Clostridia bacterium]